MNKGWSREELKGAVEAYLDMQRKQRAGVPFVKQRYYEDLATRFGRGNKAFEYRMQNISYVLALMGREWLPGLMPARNIRGRMAAEVEALINEATGYQTAPAVEWELAVREELQKGPLPVPSGRRRPEPTAQTVTTHQRDPRVKAWVLQQADGVCECCRHPAPFRAFDGQPYLELHYVRRLCDGGSDTVANAVAVCPNCHRQLHYGRESRNLVERLFTGVGRLVHE
jgi:5-methylcytosine-specific restriction enzyme A